MADFNYRGPLQPLAPEQIAQLGLAAFKPPAPAMMAGMGTPGAPRSAPGFSLADGMAMLGGGLRALRSMPAGAPIGSQPVTQAPAFGAALDASGNAILAAAHDQWLERQGLI